MSDSIALRLRHQAGVAAGLATARTGVGVGHWPSGSVSCGWRAVCAFWHVWPRALMAAGSDGPSPAASTPASGRRAAPVALAHGSDGVDHRSRGHDARRHPIPTRTAQGCRLHWAGPADRGRTAAIGSGHSCAAGPSAGRASAADSGRVEYRRARRSRSALLLRMEPRSTADDAPAAGDGTRPAPQHPPARSRAPMWMPTRFSSACGLRSGLPGRCWIRWTRCCTAPPTCSTTPRRATAFAISSTWMVCSGTSARTRGSSHGCLTVLKRWDCKSRWRWPATSA